MIDSCLIEISTFARPGPTQELYADDSRIWNAIFELITKDLATCQKDGVDVGPGEKIFPIILGNKGDWSYLVTCLVFINVSEFQRFHFVIIVGLLNHICLTRSL